MSTKALYIILSVLIVAVAAVSLLATTPAPSSPVAAPNPSPTFAPIVPLISPGEGPPSTLPAVASPSLSPSPSPSSSPMSASSPSPSPNPTVTGTATSTITYTDDGFTPTQITIVKGTTVTFVNRGTHAVWPASDPHPAHTGYPVPGGCAGSVFDACRALTPGESWSFTFFAPGNWGYHDHLNPALTGRVIVR